MATYTQILYQIVYSTKNREPTLIESGQEKLYRYIWGILRKKKCVLYQIGGIENHIHIVTHIHPTVAISNLVKDVKLASSKMIKEDLLFPNFQAWQQGYSAFTYNISAKENLVAYVKNQKEHHRKETFKEEYIRLLTEHQIEYEEKYIFE